jgi:ABC-type sugar transport system permease subunit
MIETIFLLTVFAEIFVTTSGGPGNATTNLAFLIYARALLQYDIGGASAGGVVAIVLANIVAFSWCAALPAGWRSRDARNPLPTPAHHSRRLGGRGCCSSRSPGQC